MNKVRELRIDSTSWATPARLINLLDFKPEKLSIETEGNTNNDMKVHNVRYENGGFYLTINNLRGYFNFSNNLGTLTMLLLIASAKSRSLRGASHQPAFMSSCLTISHTCLPCLPSGRVSPSVPGVI